MYDEFCCFSAYYGISFNKVMIVTFQVFYYAFAIVGMEIFQGMITYYGYNTTNASLLFCGNPLLNGSDFFAERYCGNNFNNIVNALVVLFELTVVNQWHDILL